MLPELSVVLKDYPEIKGVHPAALIFPQLDEPEFIELCADISKRGMAHRLVLTEDMQLLDGRNRLLACSVTQQEVVWEVYYGDDPYDHAISLNMQRRHLTTGQKALIAAQVASKLKAPPNEEKKASGGKATERAGKKLGVSDRAVYQAEKVSEFDDLAQLVREGAPLNSVFKEAKKRIEQQKAADPTPEPEPTTEMLTLLTDKGEKVPYPKPKAKSTFNEQKDLEIGWAMYSWNPVTGCRHTCSYCYARSLAESVGMKRTYPVGFTPLFHTERLDAPANTKVPAKSEQDPAFGRVFVCSMADLFGSWVPQDWIDKVVASTVTNPQWEYLFLTKYPQRYEHLTLPAGGWMGASIDSQRVVEPTLEALRKLKGVKHRWLSLEPLLEPISIPDLSGIDWIVIGAQSANPGQNESFAPNFEWVVDLVASARAAGTKVWLKHNLLGKTDGDLPGMRLPNELP